MKDHGSSIRGLLYIRRHEQGMVIVDGYRQILMEPIEGLEHLSGFRHKIGQSCPYLEAPGGN